jgi:hypothetical protein
VGVANKSPSFGVKQESRLKRSQRWLSNERVSMDGSTIGRGCLVLMLSVRYRSRALPLVWTVVRGTKGHFPATAHCQLVKQVLPLIPAGADVIFLGD